jgi:hypothetical protein
VDVNEGPAFVQDPNPEPYQEGLFVHRDGIQVDKLLVEQDGQINDPFELRIKEKLKGFSYSLNYRFIQNQRTGTAGSPRVNKKCFDGLRQRLDDPKYGMNPACKIDGGGVNLAASGTSTDAAQMEYLLEQAFDELGSPTGEGIVILGAPRFLRSWNRVTKKQASGGGFRYDKDALDRQITMFMNARVQSVGRVAPTGINRVQAPVISVTETANGSADTGATFTSIYLVNMGLDTLHGWQYGPMKPTAPILLPNQTHYQVMIEGTVGLNHPSTRAFARIYDIDMGA